MVGHLTRNRACPANSNRKTFAPRPTGRPGAEWPRFPSRMRGRKPRSPARRGIMAVSLKVNGTRHSTPAEPDTPLLYVLRNDLFLVGAKFGCGLAQCGACTVLVDGRATRSCV